MKPMKSQAGLQGRVSIFGKILPTLDMPRWPCPPHHLCQPGVGRGALPAVDLLLQPLVQLLRDVGPAGHGTAEPCTRPGSPSRDHTRHVSATSAVLPICKQRTDSSAAPLPAHSSAWPPLPPPRLTRVLVSRLLRPVHGVEQRGHQPIVGLLVGTNQVGEGLEALGLDALDGLGRQRGEELSCSPFCQLHVPRQPPAGQQSEERSAETSAPCSRQGCSLGMLFLG